MGHTDTGYLYFCSCAIRDAAASGRSALLLSATLLLLRLYFNKKSSYHAGRLLYSSSGELALP